jgi:hypothetical protein
MFAWISADITILLLLLFGRILGQIAASWELRVFQNDWNGIEEETVGLSVEGVSAEVDRLATAWRAGADCDFALRDALLEAGRPDLVEAWSGKRPCQRIGTVLPKFDELAAAPERPPVI